VQLYEKKKELYGVDTYCHISEILKEAKSFHKAYFIAQGKTDHEQSWRAIRIEGLR
jgi:c-di-AMP phosphodiesterase-like protein